MAERKFTRGLSKPGSAAQVRETVREAVRESTVLVSSKKKKKLQFVFLSLALAVRYPFPVSFNNLITSSSFRVNMTQALYAMLNIVWSSNESHIQ